MKLRIVLSLALLLLLIPASSGIMEEQNRTFVPYIASSRLTTLGHGVSVHREYWDCTGLQRLGVKSVINWQYPPYCPGVQAVGMQWGMEETLPAPDYIDVILGFNEPDVPGQSDMQERQGAVKWHDDEEVVHSLKLLGSPATTPEGIGWLTRWRDEYVGLYGKSPRVDYVVLHCYGTCGDDGDARDCCQYIRDQIYLIDLFGARGIIMAEFGYPTCWEGEARTIEEMEELVHFFTETEEVVGWFWFIDTMKCDGSEKWWPWTDCKLQLRDFDTGELTALGVAYRDLSPIDYADPRADVDGNKSIDILDLVIVGSSFRKPVR